MRARIKYTHSESDRLVLKIETEKYIWERWALE